MNRLLIGLGVATGVVLLVLVGFLAGTAWNRPGPDGDKGKDQASADKGARPGDKEEKETKPGEPGKKRTELPDPPPPPPPVTNEVRVRENLKPGRTYLVKTQLAFSMRGTDRDYGGLVNS